MPYSVTRLSKHKGKLGGLRWLSRRDGEPSSPPWCLESSWGLGTATRPGESARTSRPWSGSTEAKQTAVATAGSLRQPRGAPARTAPRPSRGPPRQAQNLRGDSGGIWGRPRGPRPCPRPGAAGLLQSATPPSTRTAPGRGAVLGGWALSRPTRSAGPTPQKGPPATGPEGRASSQLPPAASARTA